MRQLDRGTSVGSAISAIAGVSWSLWAATGLSHLSVAAALIEGGAGSTIGLLIFLSIARARSTVTTGQRPSSMFSTRPYLLVVLGEIVAIFLGILALRSIGGTAYIPAWVACIVGVHFLGFGRFFRTGFYLLGGALIGAAAIGTGIGLAGGGQYGITATTGILAAGCLFTAAAHGITSPTKHTNEKPTPRQDRWIV